MGSMFSIWILKQKPPQSFSNILLSHLLLPAKITHLNDFVLCIHYMNMSNLNLNEFFSSKFFHDQRWTIAEPSLTRDGRHGIAMTIEAPPGIAMTIDGPLGMP